ncbi:hypothetical protein WR25_17438 isoform B [Diploscapter pachys]|uniref:glucuronosyltransferase n=1 Tax=Diploscapter pachys TaxID=2018661 RepID=A0A2A2JIX7_9BILA|nr:hypothetical protein WR25_17438 isoform A [Diploscapter pachys]PAV61552.1 hypothetical protein WR25_17438 isoform B [Diploscapter pachys]
MTIFERMQNLISQLMAYIAFSYIARMELDAVEEIVGKKDINELLSKIAYSFHNSHPYIDFPRPEMPKTIPIGGITLEKQSKVKTTLAKEWNEVLNKRATNVLISFGSFVRTSDMPEDYKKSFISLFESFPNTTFIWKYENPEEDVFQGIGNLVLTEWMPQVALLADPRLNLFITHGAIGSTIEVTHSGVPALVVRRCFVHKIAFTRSRCSVLLADLEGKSIRTH